MLTAHCRRPVSFPAVLYILSFPRPLLILIQICAGIEIDVDHPDRRLGKIRVECAVQLTVRAEPILLQPDVNCAPTGTVIVAATRDIPSGAVLPNGFPLINVNDCDRSEALLAFRSEEH